MSTDATCRHEGQYTLYHSWNDVVSGPPPPHNGGAVVHSRRPAPNNSDTIVHLEAQTGQLGKGRLLSNIINDLLASLPAAHVNVHISGLPRGQACIDVAAERWLTLQLGGS